MIELVGLLLAILGLALCVFVGMLGDAPLARYAIARALRKLPRAERLRYREEWRGDLVVLQDQPLRLLLWAWGLTVTTSALASELAEREPTGQAHTAAEVRGAQTMPIAVVSLPDSYALRMELEAYGIADAYLRRALLDHGVNDVRLWRQTRLGDALLSHYWLRDLNGVPTGQVQVTIRNQRVVSFTVWNLDDELLDASRAQ